MNEARDIRVRKIYKKIFTDSLRAIGSDEKKVREIEESFDNIMGRCPAQVNAMILQKAQEHKFRMSTFEIGVMFGINLVRVAENEGIKKKVDMEL